MRPGPSLNPAQHKTTAFVATLMSDRYADLASAFKKLLASGGNRLAGPTETILHESRTIVRPKSPESAH
jgi:hypothetical protein